MKQGDLLRRLRPMLLDRFGIGHTTIQVEPAGYDDCGGAGDCGADRF